MTRAGSQTLRRPGTGRSSDARRDRRRRQLLVGASLALVAVVAIVSWAVLGGGDGDGDDRRSDDTSAGGATTTSLVTGGIEVAAPEGWRAVPLPQFGFGVAIPADWEAAVLSDDTLADLAGAAPTVPGFLEAAHAARQAGAVLYAAGVDEQGRVTDLKVRAEPATGITDVPGLEAHAQQLATEAGVPNPTVRVVEGAAAPTVEVSYQATAQRPGDDPAATPQPVAVQGTERVVLGPAPRNVVYSLVVTSEDAPDHATLATRLLDTLTFPPA